MENHTRTTHKWSGIVSAILVSLISVCFLFVISSCSLNNESEDYECWETQGAHIPSSEWYPVVLLDTEINIGAGYVDASGVTPNGGTSSYHARICTACGEVLEDTAEPHVFGPCLENYPDDAPCTACGIIRTNSLDYSEGKEYYWAYGLYIYNLTQKEKTEIVEILRWKYNNIVMSNYDKDTGTYSIRTQAFTDSHFMPILKDIRTENGTFSLERTKYEVQNLHGVTKSQIQYVLDNIIVRNGTISIAQYFNKTTEEYFFTIEVSNLIDWYDYNRVIKVFSEAGMEYEAFASGRTWKDYDNVDKATLLDYYSGTETGVKVRYTVNGGKFYGLEEFFVIFTETGENRNPYITEFYNDNILIDRPE